MPRVLIIGTGIAGLFAALRLANADFEVEIITKQRPKDSSTNWAQGGIAAILDKTNLQAIDGHIKDTLDAGDGLCDERRCSNGRRRSGRENHGFAFNRC